MRKAIQLRVENFGLIREAELEITPLTIFIGDNNSNKSWLSYAIYGIFEGEILKRLVDEYLIEKEIEELKNTPFGNFIIDLSNKFSKKNIEQIDLYQELRNGLINNFLNDLTIFFSKKFVGEMFKLPSYIFDKTNFEIKLSSTFRKYLLSFFYNRSFNIEASLDEKNSVRLYKEEKNNFLIIETKFSPELPKLYIQRVVIEVFLNFLRQLFFHRAVSFPSERKALATLEEHLQIDIDSLEKILPQHLKQKDIPYPILLDFFLKKRLSLPKIMKDFIQLVNDLGKPSSIQNNSSKLKIALQKMMGGKIVYEKKSTGYIQFIPEKNSNLSLPVYSTSSLVKSLSTFFLFLDKIAQGKELVIIDEPEMNLHPDAQLQFIELLTAFVNMENKFKSADNFLIITTHTPYLIDHLENLIDGFEIENEDKAKVLLLQMEESFISPDKISCYHFSKEGKITSIFNRKKKRFNKFSFSEIGGEILYIEEKLWNMKKKSKK